MLVEREAAVPERQALFGVDELVVERDAREHRADRQYDQRDQHRRVLFRSVIARGAVAMRVVGVRVGMIVMAVIAMIAVHRVLDMLALFPARLAVKGQEDEAPRIEAGEEGDENADPESDNPAAAARERRLEDAALRIDTGKETGRAAGR